MGILNIFYLLFTNRNFLFIVGIVLGFVLGDRTVILKDFTPYIIGFILAVSTSGFKFRSFIPIFRNIGPVVSCILLNYLIYGLLLLLLAYIFAPSQDIWIGYVVIAATPPAVAIIPFAANLNGDLRFAISGVFGGNLLGILITPIIFFIFVGDNVVSHLSLMDILLKMLIIPIFVSRLFRIRRIYPFFEKYRGIMVDYGFLVIAMTVIGLSRNLIFENPDLIRYPLMIFLFIMFFLGGLFKYILSRYYPDKEVIVTLSLMLTVKNAGFAAVVALSLFENNLVAIPAAILSVLLPVFYMFESTLGKYFLKKSN